MKGKFICFCGLDGSGKTTQANLLKVYFNSIGIKCEVVHGFKPGKYNEFLKSFAKKQGVSFREAYPDTIRSISYLCDMYETYYEKIERLLKNDYIVISDKFAMDSIVNAPLLGANERIINDFSKVIPEPYKYIYLSIKPEEAFRRVNERGNVGESRKNKLEFMQNTYSIYQNLNQRYNNIITINGEQDINIINNNIIKSLEGWEK